MYLQNSFTVPWDTRFFGIKREFLASLQSEVLRRNLGAIVFQHIAVVSSWSSKERSSADAREKPIP